jgi:hypothetical protein
VKQLLENGSIQEAIEIIEKNSHPKLWSVSFYSSEKVMQQNFIPTLQRKIAP